MHTVIVSDMHLSEAARPDPKRPLWMAYKRREFFIDDDFARFLTYIEEKAGGGPIELILNGDIFDFDSVTQVPDGDARVDWLARRRGLGSEEWMSLFKMEVIIREHPVWFGALAAFIARGNRAVFVIGNHDVELYWPGVQQRICEALAAPPPATLLDESTEPVPPAAPVVFCNWFYLSGGDTYVSHGHQYDPHCVVKNPIDPLIEVRGRPRVRVPFGDLAARYMLNGMGYFNPHATDNYIMTARSYLRFFWKYMARTQPFLVWTWFWGAVTTCIFTFIEFWRPAMRDPLIVEEKDRTIARRANATPAMVRRLDALHVHSSSINPFAIMRELWLDRALFFLLVVISAWFIVLTINIALPISPLWVVVPLAIMLFPFAMYAASVKPSVFAEPLLSNRRAELIHKITGAKNVVFGHTHQPVHERVGPVNYVNGGSWSPAFREPECETRIGTQTFVWLRPRPTLAGDPALPRDAGLWEWPPGGDQALRLDPRRPPRVTGQRKAVAPPPGTDDVAVG
jgi:UDP-2,3-diacylglucosamine pyrophosphatase LpxH